MRRRRPIPTRRSRSTSASAASGARSCRASATRSRAGRRSWRSIRRTSTRCAPSPPTTSSAGAWEELSQTLRRLIQVGQLGGSGIERDELKELYSQLGELEGETLMRTQDAIDAWREVLELDAADFRALAALERLFMQEARWEEASTSSSGARKALASPNDRVDVLMQAASLWADKIGDGGSAAEVYERVLQIDPGHQTASIELEQLYRQRKSWVKLVELLLARTEFSPDAATRIAAARAGGGDLRAAARRSRERVRDAAGGVPRGLLERPRRQGAGAAGDGGRQVERADRRVHAGRAGDRRSASRRPICG